MRNDVVHAVELMKVAVKDMIDRGFTDTEIKKIASFVIVEQLIQKKTADEKLDYLSKQSIFE